MRKKYFGSRHSYSRIPQRQRSTKNTVLDMRKPGYQRNACCKSWGWNILQNYPSSLLNFKVIETYICECANVPYPAVYIFLHFTSWSSIHFGDLCVFISHFETSFSYGLKRTLFYKFRNFEALFCVSIHRDSDVSGAKSPSVARCQNQFRQRVVVTGCLI